MAKKGLPAIHPGEFLAATLEELGCVFRLMPDHSSGASRAAIPVHAGRLVAAHARASERGQRSTRRAHRPAGHVAIIERTLEYTLSRAAAIGVATAELIRQQARRRLHPEETLRSAQGILRLARDFSPAQLERACERALVLQCYSYRAVRTLIETPEAPAASPALDLAHQNLRGPEYFQ